VRARISRALADRALRLARRLGDGTVLRLRYPVASANRPRWGHGRPPHARLERLLAAREEVYRSNLELVAGFRNDLAAIPTGPTQEPVAHWLNSWLPALDCATLYAFLRSRAPRRYVEVGSGNSTLWASRAIADGGLTTRITSIDPQPRRHVDELCDEVVRLPLEDADLALFGELEAGDLVFTDGSHRTFMNSDATTFFLDVLPELAPGVLVGIHDVFLPEDYPPVFGDSYLSEQYLLAAYLLGGSERVKPELPCRYVSRRDALVGVLDELWSHPAMPVVVPAGWCFWLEMAA
jgi:predicted O-methyltransferase YrrM